MNPVDAYSHWFPLRLAMKDNKKNALAYYPIVAFMHLLYIHNISSSQGRMAQTSHPPFLLLTNRFRSLLQGNSHAACKASPCQAVQHLGNQGSIG